jgi:hypothetical protein
LLDASAEEIWGGSQSADFVGQYVHQLGFRIRPAVGQMVLEMVPDSFVGVQFRSVRGERHEVKTARASEEFLHRIAAMDGAVVQQHDQMPTDLTQEMAQEDDHLCALNVVLVEQAVQRAMEAPRADGDPGDRGDSVVAIPMMHDGGLSDRTPRFAHGRDQEEPRFVDKQDVGRQPCGVFFTTGQTDRFQSAIAASLRSTARRSGFWWLQPTWWRSLPT